MDQRQDSVHVNILHCDGHTKTNFETALTYEKKIDKLPYKTKVKVFVLAKIKMSLNSLIAIALIGFTGFGKYLLNYILKFII